MPKASAPRRKDGQLDMRHSAHPSVQAKKNAIRRSYVQNFYGPSKRIVRNKKK
jgi:hypothetical protein